MEAEDVIQRVQALAEYREQYMTKHGKPPSFQQAIREIGISMDEVHACAIDLYIQWYEEDFHC